MHILDFLKKKTNLNLMVLMALLMGSVTGLSAAPRYMEINDITATTNHTVQAKKKANKEHEFAYRLGLKKGPSDLKLSSFLEHQLKYANTTEKYYIEAGFGHKASGPTDMVLVLFTNDDYEIEKKFRRVHFGVGFTNLVTITQKGKPFMETDLGVGLVRYYGATSTMVLRGFYFSGVLYYNLQIKKMRPIKLMAGLSYENISNGSFKSTTVRLEEPLKGFYPEVGVVIPF